jgi:DNA invertase Pin-like site-specific DNA recombinase
LPYHIFYNKKINMKIAIYARYSSDAQKATSIDDQIFLCKKLIKEKFNVNEKDIMIFADAAKSGEKIVSRDAFKNLLNYVRINEIDIVVAEGLDRLSRSLADTAHTFDIFTYYNTKIFTSQEGEINELHVGLKGTMNSLFLKDLRTKIKRGQEARVAAGYAAGRPPYGYKPLRGKVDEKNKNINGLREIDPEQAKIIKRIYEEYVSGKNVTDIIRDLNDEGVPSPGGKKWRRWRILGYEETDSGILRSECYIGKIIYNRTKSTFNPETKKRIRIVRPQSEWIKSYVPTLRIIDDELWEKAQKIKSELSTINKVCKIAERKEKKGKGGLTNPTYNQTALTGFVYCGICGGQKTIGKFKRYICNNNRYAKTCKNGRSATEKEIFLEVEKSIEESFRKITDFNSIFEPEIKNNEAIKELLQKRINEKEKKLNNLVDGIEKGLKNCLPRAIELQKELKTIKKDIKRLEPIELAEDKKIRLEIAQKIKEIIASKNEDDLRSLFLAMIEKIVLTPKPDKKIKEDIKVYLKSDCWFNVYKDIIKK